MGVIYRLRFILLAIWGPTINPSSNVVSETDNYLYARTLFLLFPRLFQESFYFLAYQRTCRLFLYLLGLRWQLWGLFYYLAFYLKISNQRPFVRKKFFRFI